MINPCCGIALVRRIEIEIKSRELFWAHERSHDSPTPEYATYGRPQRIFESKKVVNWMACLQCGGNLAGPNRSPAFSN